MLLKFFCALKKEMNLWCLKYFSIYDDCEPVGVELPKTSVHESVLTSIGLGKESSTKEIMYELTRKGYG